MLAGNPARAEDPGQRLSELRALVYDPKAMFSVSAVLGELDAIERQTAPDSAERGRIMHLRSVVEEKGQRQEDSIRDGEAALQNDAAHPFLTGHDRAMLHYAVARQAEELGECAVAVPHYEQALPMIKADGASESQVLGTQQSLAYCLHEVGRYADARRMNEDTLAAAARLFGADSPKLFSTRVNLAQNQYSLGDHDAARRTLEGLLADATKADDTGKVDAALFQLGVLAYEDGRPADARVLMERRLALAKQSGNETRLDAAQRDLDVLYDKLSQGAGH